MLSISFRVLCFSQLKNTILFATIFYQSSIIDPAAAAAPAPDPPTKAEIFSYVRSCIHT